MRTTVWLFSFGAIGILASHSGCTEFAHFGQISDREGTFPVNAVQIYQQDNDGTWREIGESDGKGKWNILKAKISGGGRIKLQKQGYRTVIMSESEFLQQNNILMDASDEAYPHATPEGDWNSRS